MGFSRIHSRPTLVFLALMQRVDFAVAAAASTTVVAAVADYAGYDPWTWVIGALGAIVVYIKKEVTTRIDAMVNSAISVVLAGLVSPGLTHYVVNHLSIALPNTYPMAFIISAAWPWIVPTILSVIKPGKK